MANSFETPIGILLYIFIKPSLTYLSIIFLFSEQSTCHVFTWNHDNIAFNLALFRQGEINYNVNAHQRTRRHCRIPLTSLNTVRKEAFRCGPDNEET